MSPERSRGIRFYKGTGNTGTHTGTLWSAGGTLLATGTFTDETATGWQQLDFDDPVLINADTTYVVSYFAPNGHYAYDSGQFTTAGVDNAPIHLLATGVDGINGLYQVGATSAFPTDSYGATNYWVDVVFDECPCAIFGTATPSTPATSDTDAVELGVKFQADADGEITGIRFYKGTGNTGTHTGTLWSAGGTLLATGTFTDETSTGWQHLTFDEPVAITADTTYVASYLAPNGHYASNGGQFTSAGFDNPPLHALQTGIDGTNGVYHYGATERSPPTATAPPTTGSTSPTKTTTRADTTPPAVTATTPALNQTGTPTDTTIAATFTESVQSDTIDLSVEDDHSETVDGDTTYNASTHTATFTPDQPLSPGATYTATISGAEDTPGNTMTPAVTWTFTTTGATTTSYTYDQANRLSRHRHRPRHLQLQPRRAPRHQNRQRRHHHLRVEQNRRRPTPPHRNN